MLEEKLNSLKNDIINYTNLVQAMIEKSATGLFERNKDIIDQVIDIDEHRANEIEIEIEEICTQLIAQFQPKAKDLRTILMISKMNNDLERIADLAVNVAKGSIYLIGRTEEKPLQKINQLKGNVVKMLNDTTRSFIREDVILARNVVEADNDVDELRDSILRDLVTFLSERDQKIGKLIHYIKISRKIERIASHMERMADHITNIAEDIVFMVEGKVIKHPGD